MSELQDMLRVQARLHRKQGANALGDLFQSAALEIEILTERLENPQGLQELICVEQMKEISLPEIHRANQKLHEQLAKANERVKELEKGNKSCAVAIREIIAKGDIGPLLVTGPELDEIVSKFAIETRAKALQSLLNKKCPVSGYVIRDKESREIIAEELEQLRTEQAQ